MTDRRRVDTRPRAPTRSRELAGLGYDRAGYQGEPEPEGRHLGPIPITATGVLLVIALVLSVAWLAWKKNKPLLGL